MGKVLVPQRRQIAGGRITWLAIGACRVAEAIVTVGEHPLLTD